jgi:biopolymer transport protein ExbB/TolQ
VAIPALAIYYWLHARVDRYVHEIDNLVVDVVDSQELAPVGVQEGTS